MYVCMYVWMDVCMYVGPRLIKADLFTHYKPTFCMLTSELTPWGTDL